MSKLQTFLLFLLFFCISVYSDTWTVSSDSSLAAGNYSFDTLTINSNVTLLCKGDTVFNVGVVISCYNLTINSTGRISADTQGYPVNQGPGTPPGLYSGGSYGGYGGKRSPEGGLGAVYGSTKNPTALGSGGYIYNGTGNGGGCIILIVSNELKVNGIISANGEGQGGGGAGSGGTIKINTKILSGSGQITANGGTAIPNIGDGGGGRIAIYYEQNNFTGTILARRGTSSFSSSITSGGCGTIFMKSPSQANGDLILDGAGYPGDNYTPISGQESFDTIILKGLTTVEVPFGSSINATNLNSDSSSSKLRLTGRLNLPGSFSFSSLTIISNGGMVIPDGNLTIGSGGILEVMNNTLTLTNLIIKNSGKLTHSANNIDKIYWLDLTVNNNLTVESGGTIDVTNKGYAKGYGPGTPQGGAQGGASYGGIGIIYVPGGGTPGPTYGSDTWPIDLGSGSGYSGVSSPGGGAVSLLVWGTLRVDGTILSESILDVTYTGSGGSILIRTPNFTGSGRISVKGGQGVNATGGGGGRMAIYYAYNDYTGTFDTSPGIGTADTTAGTRYMQQMIFHLPPRITSIDNPAYSSPIPGKRPTFRWTATTDQENDTLQFEIQISQDSSFSSVTVSASSDNSTAGFQYSTNSGITWENFPSVGVKSDSIPPVKASYTVQQDLWVGYWYWRVRAKDLDGNGNWSDTGYLPSIIGDLLVKITSPADSIAVYVDRIKVEGTIEQSVGQTISVNGASSNLDLTNNAFSVEVNLEIGKNEIVVTGNGVLANYVSDTVVVYRLRLPVSVLEEKVGANGGTIRLDDRDEDKENDTRIEIEPGTLEREVKVTLKNLDGDTPIYGNIPSYEIFVDGKEHYRFKKKIKIVLSYRNLNAKETEEDKLKIFHWDGVKWQLVGGEINKTKKVVSTYTNHVSRYAVMVLPASKEIMVSVFPPIFTPNGDGINDMVVFNCYSGNSAKLEIRIYDSAGRNVRDIREEVTGSGISLAWDGLDANNNLAETGVYLYNVIVSEKTASSGTVIIAK